MDWLLKMLKVIHRNGARYCWDVVWIVPSPHEVLHLFVPSLNFVNGKAQDRYSKQNLYGESSTLKTVFFTISFVTI